ncbi:MAG: ABC transporter ATP-binding protein, partial [Desulfurococcaceae archaeon]
MFSVELSGVWVYYGSRSALRGVSAKFTPGVHVVLGRNGAGKTTLLRAIARLVEFRGGITVLGRSVRELRRREIARLVGYCWQNPYYGFIEASVRDELRAVLESLRVPGDWRVVEILVPEELLERDPSTLSGGEAKRVSLASVLVADQPVWLLDEPFTFLDESGVEALVELV